MNAVCTEVSKGKSTVPIFWPFGEVVRLSTGGLDHVPGCKASRSRGIHYHEPVAVARHEQGINVSMLNPRAIYGFNPDG